MLNNLIPLMQQFSKAQNPMGMMMQMFGANPQFQQVMQIVQSKSPQELEQYTRNLCKSQNIDVDNLIKMVKPF